MGELVHKVLGQGIKVAFTTLCFGLALSSCMSAERKKELSELKREKGKVESITCLGNQIISCESLGEEFYPRVGGAYSQMDILDAEASLRASDLVENVKITDLRDAGLISISVEERSPRIRTILETGATRGRKGEINYAGALRARYEALNRGRMEAFLEHSNVPKETNNNLELSFARLHYQSPLLFKRRRWFYQLGLQNIYYNFQSKEPLKDSGDFSRRLALTNLDLALGYRFYFPSEILAGYVYVLEGGGREQDFYSFTSPQLSESWVTFKDGVFLTYKLGGPLDSLAPGPGFQFSISGLWLFPNTTVNRDMSPAFFLITGLEHVLYYQNGASGTLRFGNNKEFRFRQNKNLGISYEYAKDFNWSLVMGSRWYLQGGIDYIGYSSYSGWTQGSGLKGGVRFDTTAFGLIDFYLMGLF